MSTPTKNGGKAVKPAESKDSEPEQEARTAAAVGTPPLDLVNPGTTPMSYDIPGHQIDAGGRVSVDSVDKVGRRAVRSGYLLCQDVEDRWISFTTAGDPVARPLTDSQRATAARGASQPE